MLLRFILGTKIIILTSWIILRNVRKVGKNPEEGTNSAQNLKMRDQLWIKIRFNLGTERLNVEWKYKWNGIQ